jgi:polyhydroxyalkanoate synthase subunit PhaC
VTTLPRGLAGWSLPQQRALFGELRETSRRLRSLPRVIRQARATEVGTTPHDVVLTRGTFKLLRYRRQKPATYTEPILFCYALINRPYILDLQPDKSIVGKYLEQGLDVYMIDWGVPSDADHRFTIEDYVRGFLRESIAFVLREHEIARLHLLGYCMGGTLAAIFTALQPEQIRTLTLLASPIDFAGKESLLNVWADAAYFDVDAFVDAFENCPALLLQLCFLYIKPVQNLIQKWIGLYENMADAAFVTNFFALERWVNDNIPVAGETFREFVKNFYQGNELVRGRFRLGAQLIDLRQIVCPLLLLTAEADHLVPPPSTEGIRPHVASKEIDSIRIGVGHVGLVVSSKAQTTVWPAATGWLADHSTPRVQPGSVSSPARELNGSPARQHADTA